MEKTKIDWCDSTWNPVTGCRHGCEYCYARRIAERFSPFDLPHLTEDGVLKGINELAAPIITECKDGKERICAYPYGFEPTLHRYRLEQPRKWHNPRTIFVCSMADLFGSWVPDEWIEEVFWACERAPQHNYLFLTKNPDRYNALAEKGMLPENLWYGYSATRQSNLWRFRHADECRVKNLFVSIEPILEEMKPGFCSHCPSDWVIIGAETGNRKDKVIPKHEWIENIVTECEYAGIPLFMKSSLAEIWGEPLIQEFPDGMLEKRKIRSSNENK